MQCNSGTDKKRVGESRQKAPRKTPRDVHGAFPSMTHIYRWNRQSRKGQECRLIARGKMNSICVEFADGYRMITSGNAIRRNAIRERE